MSQVLRESATWDNPGKRTAALLADRPIRDILATPCPEAFSRLWAADVAHWHSHRSTSSKGDLSNVHCNSIERVVGKQQKREAARAADFRHLVAEVVDGREPDADKSLDNLSEAAERLAGPQKKEAAMRERMLVP